jgi:dUTP pyrophosphatase
MIEEDTMRNPGGWPARPVVKFRRLTGGDLELPSYATEFAAGIDLPSAQDFTLLPDECALLRTGFAVEIPTGYEGQMRGRSGLASRGVLAHVGTIDSDYRGELGVVLYNFSRKVVQISRGDRIGQLVIAPLAMAQVAEVTAGEELSATARGAGGYGSTGR